MTARILVVDDVPANLRLLEARLTAEYYDVVTARSGQDALDICESSRVDVVLLDIMMPGMDGFEVCERLKSDSSTAHIPVVIVTALDGTEERIRGLEAGADDFLTKPVNDLQLVTRVKSLARLKALTDELRLRAETTRNIEIEQILQANRLEEGPTPGVLLVEEEGASADRIARMLRGQFDLKTVSDPQKFAFGSVGKGVECILVSTRLGSHDPLRLCAHLRALESTRSIPIVLLADGEEEDTVVRGLELGINDYLVKPIEKQELVARLRTQIRRKRYNDGLRSSFARTVEMAVTDPLTGLHNRRYLDSHLQTLFDRARARNKPLSIMFADIDRFKTINDSWGHDGGDAVLREFAARLRKTLRAIDLVCRYGGEEFVVVMPETDLAVAERVAERVRGEIAGEGFRPAEGKPAISVTASLGVAASRGTDDDSLEQLVKRADEALYEAKRSGRNRVVAPAA